MKHGCNIIMDSMNGEQIQTQETKSEDDDTETPSKNEDAYLVWMARNSAAAA